MAEIKTPLIELREGETYTADADGAFVITETHTHNDILRYVINDEGPAGALILMKILVEEALNGES